MRLTRQIPVAHGLTVCLALLVLSALSGTLQTQSARPNILVIVADDLGVDSTDAYATAKDLPETPNLRALAARGMRFNNAYAMPNCSPSRTSYFTGRYAFRHLVGTFIDHENIPQTGYLLDREQTVAEVMKEASSGYATALFGKWHSSTHRISGMDAPRTLGGFEHFAGTINGNPLAGAADYYSWMKVENGSTWLETTYKTISQTDDAIRWISWQKTPWFANLHFTAPHWPFDYPPRQLMTASRIAKMNQPTDREKYLAMVEAMDQEIGRLLKTLPANTYVFFFGDNGTPRGIGINPDTTQKAKGTPFEGGIHVPLIVTGPAVKDPGTDSDAFVHVVDVFSTVVELSGSNAALAPWIERDGRSLVPVLDGTRSQIHEFVYSEKFRGDRWIDAMEKGFVTVRQGQYKMIRYFPKGRRQEQFIDLIGDPIEAFNMHTTGIQGRALVSYNKINAYLKSLRSTPEARIVAYGSRTCTGSRGALKLTTRGVPALGQSYEIGIENAAPNSLAILAVDLEWSKVDLTLMGGKPGCFLLTPTRNLVLLTTDFAGRASITSPTLPMIDDWIYRTLFVQGLALDRPTPLGFITSEAIAVVTGF